MSCGCGRPKRHMIPASAQRGQNNFYSLATFPDCDVAYQGEWQGYSIFVVAPGDTEKERLFGWGDYEQAVTYTTELGQSQMDSVPTTSLCQQAVESVYA